jgi:myo-inositol-1(or 4)-monophosphatase
MIGRMALADLSKYLEFITETAYLAGRKTLAYFQTGVHADYKGDDTPITIADRQAEELIRSRIEKRYPQHAIIGEEFGDKEGLGESHRWLIDPIDGTKSFMRGVPLYAVLIGLEIEGRVEAGAAYFPALDEMIVAASGLGCWWNGRRAHVSKVTDLKRSIFGCTSTQNFHNYNRKAEFERLLERFYFQTGWGDAYGYLLVATGRIELMLDPIMAVWDCAPFPAILREAGGYFGDWQGNETIYAHESLATSWKLLPKVLEIINGN